MKLLLASRFPPSLGGVETMGVLIAREWGKDPTLQLKIITDIPGAPLPDAGYELYRTPSLTTLHRLYRWADAVFFNHCYLKLSAPLLWQRKPYALSMSGTLETLPSRTPAQKIKRLLLSRLLSRASVNIAACEYVKRGNRLPATVIPNPYDSSIYHNEEAGERPWDFFFGGRVTQEPKGCFDLIDAFAICQQQTGRSLTLSVAGDGPDLSAMKQRAASKGLTDKVRFLGVLRGTQLADEMRRHKVIVVPSRYQEPIGIICLEGIACGCIAVGSSGGGLGESVGPCGFTFLNGDVPGLTSAMLQAISPDPDTRQTLRHAAAAHLSHYAPDRVAAQYLSMLKCLVP